MVSDALSYPCFSASESEKSLVSRRLCYARFCRVRPFGLSRGQITMWLKNNTNLVWCGYYLGPTPMTNRAKLVANGWGISPFDYVANWCDTVTAGGYGARYIAATCWPCRSTPYEPPAGSGPFEFPQRNLIQFQIPFRIPTPPDAATSEPTLGNSVLPGKCAAG
jgi:hypothetical protein